MHAVTFVLFWVAFSCPGAFGQVSSVRAEQRAGTKLVEVRYNLDAMADVSLAVTDGGQTVSVQSVSGDVGYQIGAGTNLLITWNAGKDWNGNISTTMVFSVTTVPLYLVIDLSGGPSATNYPVSYLSEVPLGGWTEEYKTTKLVLRRIPAGTFTMGSPVGEVGRGSDETQHEVTISQPFYMGVFEVTQKQWERVMGTWPSRFTNVTYRDSRPVEQVSYYDIRENPNNSDDPAVNWPANSAVNANSFMGKLRAKTGLSTLDLPTESQWEYAGRAGTTTALNSGQNLTNEYADTSMDAVGRYQYNHPGGYSSSSSVDTNGGTATVGSYQANAWGLYDIHGNVWEWCLDWKATYPGTVTDPAGAASGLNRGLRGGYWANYARYCRSALRSGSYPSNRGKDVGLSSLGFRLAGTLR